MSFSSCFSHCDQIQQVVKDMFVGGIPHHHVVKLEVVIRVAKVRVFLIN
jgi:hypothetical protein